MTLVLIGWSAAAVALIGIGLWAGRALRLNVESGAAVFDAFWLGMALALAFLQVYHLFRPVDTVAAALLLVVGGAGCIVHARPLATVLGRAVCDRLGMCLCVFGAFWLANRALGPCMASDSGLYHLIGMRWVIEHPIVPGLANLCGPLGFNNSILLYDAALDIGPWEGRTSHLATPVLLLVTLLRAITGAQAIFRDPGRMAAIRAYQASLLVVVVDSAISPHGASISTDLPAVLMLFGAADALLRLLLRPDRSEACWLAVVAGTVSVAAITVKVSAIAMGAGIWAIAFGGVLTDVRACGPLRNAYDRAVGCRPVVAMGLLLALPTLLLGVWIARGVVLSGYPLFPSTFCPMPVDWRVPREPTEALRDWVIQFARVPDIHPPRLYDQGLDWVVPWLRTMPAQGPVKSVFPVAIALFWTAALLIVRARRGIGAAWSSSGQLWLMIPLLAFTSVFWFLTAPAPRFGFVLFWVGAGVLAALTLLNLPRRPSHGVLVCVLIVQMGSVIPALLVRVWFVNNLAKRGPVALVDTLLVAPGPDSGFHPYPAADLALFRTQSGFEYWAPVNSDRVWFGPLPSSPYRDSGVRQRTPEDLEAGFVRDDLPWEPQNWPHAGSNYLELWHAGRVAPTERN